MGVTSGILRIDERSAHPMPLMPIAPTPIFPLAETLRLISANASKGVNVVSPAPASAAAPALIKLLLEFILNGLRSQKGKVAICERYFKGIVLIAGDWLPQIYRLKGFHYPRPPSLLFRAL